MLFHVYGDNAIYQWLVMLAVLAGLILLNEFARRTKAGGLVMFGVIPAVLTVYFIVWQLQQEQVQSGLSITRPISI